MIQRREKSDLEFRTDELLDELKGAEGAVISSWHAAKAVDLGHDRNTRLRALIVESAKTLKMAVSEVVRVKTNLSPETASDAGDGLKAIIDEDVPPAARGNQAEPRKGRDL